MKSMDQLRAVSKTSASQRAVLSFKAALAGWAIFVSVCLFLCSFNALSYRHAWANGQNPFIALYLFGVGSAVVVFTVGFFIALPLSLFVPDRSVFWRPQISSVLGILTGIVIVGLNQLYEFHSNSTIHVNDWNAYILGDIILPSIPAAFIGGIVGFVAGTLHKGLSNR